MFYASLLELIGAGEVLGVDVDIRSHNRSAIERHPMFRRIHMIEGSSENDAVADEVARRADGKRCVMVVLDSNHTHDHVRRELELYRHRWSRRGAIWSFATPLIEDMPEDLYSDRPWSRGNNARTAVVDFLKDNDAFVIDEAIQNQILITVSPGGYLKRVE